MRRIAICGVGNGVRRYFENYELSSDDVIVCFVDKNPHSWKLPKGFDDTPFGTYELLRDIEADLYVIGAAKTFGAVIDSVKAVKGNEIRLMSLGEYELCENPDGRSRKVKEVWSTIPAIPQKALENSRVLYNRETALQFLPKGGITAEIGVATGGFSRKILDILKPDKFYAIDMYSENIDHFWDVYFVDKRHYEWYQEHFAKDIENGVLEMKKGTSWEVLEEFPDAFFDYVYLDAGHDYESVKRDVDVLKRKVKDGGIIQFNDYIIYGYESQLFMGIVPAVNQLLNDTNSELLYYCLSGIDFDDVVIRYKR